ncbi:hypothetical protein N9B72_02160 [Bacteriovoracaceae bacterium]|nr:hypothetical protein [Bacteriovoracaceae bacterium]
MKNKIYFILFTFIFSSCADYARFKRVTEDIEIPSKVYKADRNQTWAAVLKVITKFDNAIVNAESGYIKTNWMDNTLELNFADSFGGSDKVKAAKFKLIINVVKGYRMSREVTKVTIYKRQLIENDFLQGWKELPTDSILESTLLYRVDREITIDNKLKEIDKAKEKELINNF